MIDRVLGLVPSWAYAAAIAILLGVYTVQWTTSTARIAELGVELAAAEKRSSKRIAELKIELAGEQKKHSDYVTEQTRINKAEADAARKREQELQAAADKDRRVLNVTIARIRAERDAALGRLQDRADRPQAGANGIVLPKPAGAGSTAGSCTGAELYRSDAQFLERHASQCEELRVHYLDLRSKYERARGQDSKAVKE